MKLTGVWKRSPHTYLIDGNQYYIRDANGNFVYHLKVFDPEQNNFMIFCCRVASYCTEHNIC